MYRICAKNPRFKPCILRLNTGCEREHFSVEFVDALRGDVIPAGSWAPEGYNDEECELRFCDERRIWMHFRNDDGFYRDPWMSCLLQTLGPTLKDLSLYGEDSITLDLFENIPNLTALRLYRHHPVIYVLLPVYCRCLVTLEFLGPYTYTDIIVEHLCYFEYTPMRALAIVNQDSNPVDDTRFTVANIKALGMYCRKNRERKKKIPYPYMTS